MSEVEKFLTPEGEEAVVDAIRQAEQKTSGEIRVHIERTCEMDPFEHAKEIFHQLKMDNTKLQNGVLIYLAIDDRNFVIMGDKGINDVMPQNFWETTRDIMVEHFKKGDFKQGLIDGILMAGKELQAHFPWDAHTDTNELSDQISR